MTTMFATNKTFTIAGMTSDTMEPYASVVGYQLELRNNAIGGGTHYAVAMVVIKTTYDEIEIDRAEQRSAKSAALAEAHARAVAINDLYKARVAA